MFDMVTHRPGLSAKLRLTPGALLGVVFYAAVGALAVWAQHRPHAADDRSVPVTFMKAPPPPPPPKGGGGAPDRPKPRTVTPRQVPKEALIAPTVVPDVAPMPTEPVSDAEAAGVPGGVEGGVEGGVVGGVLGGKVGGVVGSDGAVVDFDDRMTHPTFLSGPSPEYTERAIDREVQGTMLVRCIVTVDGKVFDCRVVKGLPFLDQAVVDALERRRYTPAMLNGRPVQVNYTFKITMRLPE